MRRTFARVTVWAAVTAGLVHALSAQALSLGEIHVDSLLNQRFSAVIPLAEISSDDLETVAVSVAPADAYERAGIDRSDYLDSLQFTVRNDQGRPRVEVSSSLIAREPVVNLLVQARWAGGRILREYTVLLDPPQLAPPPRPAAAPMAAPVVAPVRPAAPLPAVPAPMRPANPSPAAVAPPPAPAARPAEPRPDPRPESEFYETAAEGARPPPARPRPAPVPLAPVVKPAAPIVASMPASGEFYGPVRAQETLWSIATQLRPSRDISMDQVILALAEANPRTIQRGTTVNKGATLSVPSEAAMRALAPAQAKSRLASLRASAGPAPAAAKPAAPVPAPAAAATPAAPAVSAPQAKPAALLPAKPANSSILAAPAALAPAPSPVAKPEPAKPAAPAAPVPQPAPKVEAKPAAVAPVTLPPAPKPPAPAPAPVIAAAPSPAVAPVAPPAPKPEAAPATPAPAVPAPKVETPPAPATPAPAAAEAAAPAVAAPAPEAVVPAPAPSQAQSPPEPEGGGLMELLSNWGLPLAGLVAVLAAALLLVRRMGERARAASRSGRSRASGGSAAGEASRASSFVAGSAAAAAAGNRLGDTLVTPPKPSEGPGALEQTQAITQQIAQPAGTGGRASDFDKTLVIEPDVAASLQMSAPQSTVSQNKADFDMTTQLQAETLHINLDANDPISEADFHLAYGLYDEAILLLKQAAVKDPQRLDLKVKLAETYFAAGKPIEFQTLAEEIKPKLDAGEWSKIAIMGAQLCPSVALFKSEGDTALAADFDLGFDDEPAVPVPAAPARAEEAPLAFELPDVSIPAASQLLSQAPAAAPATAVSLEALNADIKLHLEPELSAAPAPEEDPASIDFMLGQSITPIGAGSLGSAPSLDSNLLEFDLDASLNKPAPVESGKPLPGVIDDLDFPLSVSPAARPVAAMDDAARDLKLEEFSVSLTPRESAGSSTDEFNTKLDLARAYVEMGDNEMARGLLLEVQQQGNEVQQREAGEMLRRLPA